MENLLHAWTSKLLEIRRKGNAENYVIDEYSRHTHDYLVTLIVQQHRDLLTLELMPLPQPLKLFHYGVGLAGGIAGLDGLLRVWLRGTSLRLRYMFGVLQSLGKIMEEKCKIVEENRQNSGKRCKLLEEKMQSN